MRIYFVIFFTLLVGATAYADQEIFPIKQDYFTKFESLSEKDGLPSNEVFDVIQDSIGFMWFATKNGLCRFDGYNIIVYQNTPGDSSSISNNLITCLEIDKNGNLWIGTENGLNLYNRLSEIFISFYKSTKNLNSINDNHIKALYADNQDNLWIETAGGVLHKLVISTLEIEKFKHIKPYQPYYRYHSIYEDSNQNLWIGGRGIPVAIFDRETKKFSYFRADPTNSDKKRDDDVGCYFEDSEHNFWVSATDGVYLMNREDASFKKVHRSSTFSIIEDNKGNVWLGSSIGLLKKEPKKKSFINYRKNQDNPFSIVDNHIHKLYEDNSGIIWIATANGISKYNPKKYKFGNYRHIGNLSNTLSGNRITDIIEDKTGSVWIATQSNGLNKLDPITGEITQFKFNGSIKGGLSSDRISSLYLDKQNQIWVGLWAGVGFNKLNPNTNKFSHFAFDPNSFKRDWYNDFLELSDGRFFCGIWGAMGFMEFDRNKEKFTGLHFLNTSRPKYIKIPSIQYFNGKIYFGSERSTIYCLDLNNDHFSSYTKTNKSQNIKQIDLPFVDHHPESVIKFRSINSIYSYKNHSLFFATDSGLIIKSKQSESFQIITKNKDSNLLSNNLISLYEFSQDTLCIISSGGLNFYDVKNKKLGSFSIALSNTPLSVLRIGDFLFLIYEGFIQKLHFGSKQIVEEYHFNKKYNEVKFSCALELTNDKIILGTNRGACIFDIEKGVIIEFFDQSFSNIQNWFSVNTLFRDQDQTVWMGTDIGFGKMDLAKNSIQWIRDSLGDAERFVSGNVECFTEDEDGNLWLGTEAGACIYNKKSQQLIHLSSKGDFGLSSHLINKLFEDNKGNVWIGTSDRGLNVILKNGEIRTYLGDSYDSSGYRGEDVKSIYQDSRNNIWVGGNRGLNKFISLNSPVENFSVEDDLANYSIMSILEDDNQHLWITTGNGISRFDLRSEKVIQNYDKLDGLQDNSFSDASCKLKNGILMFGGNNGISLIDPRNIENNLKIPKIAFTALSKHNELLTNDLSSGDTVIILPTTKFFSIEFAALDFTEPMKNRYRYKLIGSFDEWLDVGKEHKISFANLASGKYKLHISACNNEGIWNKEGIFLTLIVKPPFWQTWWFVSSIALIILVVGSSLLALKISSLDKEKKNVQLEQRLLRTQMNPHFIFNILAALQGLIYQKESKIVVRYLSKFASLMRSILYHSREESILLEDEIIFIENYLNLQQLRFTERFEYELIVDSTISVDIVKIPPMLLQPFIENSIEHGLSKKQENKGRISIEFKKAGNELMIEIKDNGIGIEKAGKLKGEKGNKHKSLGIETTLERIKKLNRSKKQKDHFEIVDLKEKDAKECGTKVCFSIPFVIEY